MLDVSPRRDMADTVEGKEVGDRECRAGAVSEDTMTNSL